MNGCGVSVIEVERSVRREADLAPFIGETDGFWGDLQNTEPIPVC
jgi:hypothetical protein